MGMAHWSLIGVLCFVFCVNAAKGEETWVNPLEFITMQTTNEDVTKYGFQLLEDVRKVRMTCMEHRDALERQFADELETWTKYSQQTQQVISEEGYQQYGMENREILEKNLQLGFREMYNGRSRRLQTIQDQCDNDLEDLLQTRKVSLLRRSAELMAKSPEKLRHLIRELLSYNSRLQDGVQNCIHTQTEQFESGVTSRLNQPEDYCYASDISIVNVFIKQMAHLIQEEQMTFFGDDEDLVSDGPCGASGCEEPRVVTTEKLPTVAHSMIPTAESTPKEPTEAAVSTVPPSRTPATEITRPPPASDEPPTSPSLPATTDEKPSTTKPPPTTPHTKDPPTSEEMQTSPTSPEPKLPESNPQTTASPLTTTSEKPSSPDTPSPHSERPTPTTISTPTTVKTDMTEDSTTPANTEPLPDWAEDAFKEVFNAPQKQQQSEFAVDGGVDVEVGNEAVEVAVDIEVDTPEETVESDDEDYESEESHSHSHDDSSDGDRSKSRESDGDHRSRTGGRHGGSKHGNPQEIVVDLSPYFPDDAEHQAEQEDNSNDSSDSSNTYRTLIYTFTAIGGVMVAAALVLVVAILAVQHKRRKLLASQLLTQEQKIAIMKQTGYVNPTYKFFDQHKDS